MKKFLLITLILSSVLITTITIAQPTGNHPIYFGAIISSGNIPPSCLAISNFPAPPTETDPGNDPINPGVISGTFYQLNNPNNFVCGNLPDFCDPQNPEILWEGVTGSSYGPNYAQYSAIIPHDCSTLGQGFVCNNNIHPPTIDLGSYCGTPIPDLLVGAVFVVSPAPNPVIQIDVKNAGTAATTTNANSMIIIGTAAGANPQPFTIPPLAQGQSYSKQITLSYQTSQTISANVQLDFDLLITESNEANNYHTASLNI